MGSLSLVGVPHVEPDLPLLRGDIESRSHKLARERMEAAPVLTRKVMSILAE